VVDQGCGCLDQVVDVGGGTGFCTLGVVKTVKAENVTLIDQSPHQLAKAKQKPALQDVTIMEVRHLWDLS
jgi:MPBQ/MSBQ methyltransferase